jgi:hypothetical protein
MNNIHSKRKSEANLLSAVRPEGVKLRFMQLRGIKNKDGGNMQFTGERSIYAWMSAFASKKCI